MQQAEPEGARGRAPEDLPLTVRFRNGGRELSDLLDGSSGSPRSRRPRLVQTS
ncbi:hypothetical protein SBADM41S_07835 [Streptomyces badius]